MSIKVMSAVWATNLPANDKLVLLGLADCSDDGGEQCWPSIASLCLKTGMDRRTVQRAIRRLVAAGHLSRKEVAGVGCRYMVHPQPELPLGLDQRQNDTGVKMTPPSKRRGTGVKLTPKPSRTIIPSEGKPSSGRAPAHAHARFGPPDGVSPETWADYRHMRKSKMTDTAYQRLCNSLTKLKAQGHDPNEVVGQSVERGWTGFFKPRDERSDANGGGRQPEKGKTREVWERLEADRAATG